MKDDESLNPADKINREKLESLKKCTLELESYRSNKLKLKCHTFFVPGWTSEDCAAWLKPYEEIPKKYKDYYWPVAHWIDEIIENKELAHYITFTDEETKSSPSFMELGGYLKRKVLDLAQDNPVNLVGHSMGGLDIRAAILDSVKPFLKVKNVITVGTPNNGNKFVNLLVKIKNYPEHWKKQCLSMHPDSEAIKSINSLESRLKLLNSIDKFYVFMGMRDMAVTKSPKLNKEGLATSLCEQKIMTIQTATAEHSGKDGITQDARISLPIIKILTGIKLRSSGNKGYIFQKS